VAEFKNSMPGKDWAQNFLKRRPELTNRFATNIKKQTAAIDATTLACYINNLREVTEEFLRKVFETTMSLT
jgi:hypothetical protein